MNKITVLLFLLSLFGNAQTALPDVTLTNLEGKSVVLKNEFSEKDKLYIFSFWATWCVPCINELEAINEVYADWQKELNVEVVAVSIDDARTQKRVKPLLNGKGWEYMMLLDGNQDFKRALSIANIPYTVVVKNQKIVHIQNGYSQGAEKELFEKLKTL
jgi:thiol-disulfide isomerase/thioredoxin